MIPEWSEPILLNGKEAQAIFDYGEESSGQFSQIKAYDRRPTIWLDRGLGKVNDEVEVNGQIYRIARIVKTLDFDTCYLEKKKPPSYKTVAR